jgi:uncharacterized membrane protein (Fun14 family)
MGNGAVHDPLVADGQAAVRRAAARVFRCVRVGLTSAARDEPGGQDRAARPAPWTRTTPDTSSAARFSGRWRTSCTQSGAVIASSPDEDSSFSPPVDRTEHTPQSPAAVQQRHSAAERARYNSRKTTIPEQISVGSVLGLATGYSIRKIGRILAFVVGTEIVVLQYLAYKRWLVMDWGQVANDLRPNLSRSAWDTGVEILLYRLPFATAFSAGLAAGLNISK